jgi:hypothetical protein
LLVSVSKTMYSLYNITRRHGHLLRGLVLGLTVCAAVASDSTLPARPPDVRGERLEAFFRAYDCPGPLHVQDYLRAADSHDLDYRMLPAISLVESTCGAFERMNNRWGWDSVQTGFASVHAGIDYISQQLAENPKYKGKSVKEKLFTYNPYPEYVRQVERLMKEIED